MLFLQRVRLVYLDLVERTTVEKTLRKKLFASIKETSKMKAWTFLTPGYLRRYVVPKKDGKDARRSLLRLCSF